MKKVKGIDRERLKREPGAFPRPLLFPLSYKQPTSRNNFKSPKRLKPPLYKPPGIFLPVPPLPLCGTLCIRVKMPLNDRERLLLNIRERLLHGFIRNMHDEVYAFFPPQPRSFRPVFSSQFLTIWFTSTTTLSAFALFCFKFKRHALVFPLSEKLFRWPIFAIA